MESASPKRQSLQAAGVKLPEGLSASFGVGATLGAMMGDRVSGASGGGIGVVRSGGGRRVISARHRKGGAVQLLVHARRRAVGLAIAQRGVTDAGHLVGQGAGRLVVIAARLDRKGPAAQRIVIADNAMRQRDERFRGRSKYQPKHDVLYDKRGTIEDVTFFRREHFTHDEATDTYTCPAGKSLQRKGKVYDVGRGRTRKDYRAEASDCARCTLRAQCLRKPGQQRRSLHVQSSAVPDPNHPGDRMRVAIDSPRGRRLYSQRMGTVEPVFANIRHNKRLNRFHLRGKAEVNTQWHLYCLVHNIKKLAKAGLGGGENH